MGQDSRVLSKAAIPAWIREKTLASGCGDSQGDRDPSYLLQVMAASPLPPPMMWSLPHSPSYCSLPECLTNKNKERPPRRGRGRIVSWRLAWANSEVFLPIPIKIREWGEELTGDLGEKDFYMCVSGGIRERGTQLEETKNDR